jgi:hypothetical protein
VNCVGRMCTLCVGDGDLLNVRSAIDNACQERKYRKLGIPHDESLN